MIGAFREVSERRGRHMMEKVCPMCLAQSDLTNEILFLYYGGVKLGSAWLQEGLLPVSLFCESEKPNLRSLCIATRAGLFTLFSLRLIRTKIKESPGGDKPPKSILQQNLTTAIATTLGNQSKAKEKEAECYVHITKTLRAYRPKNCFVEKLYDDYSSGSACYTSPVAVHPASITWEQDGVESADIVEMEDDMAKKAGADSGGLEVGAPSGASPSSHDCTDRKDNWNLSPTEKATAPVPIANRWLSEIEIPDCRDQVPIWFYYGLRSMLGRLMAIAIIFQ